MRPGCSTAKEKMRCSVRRAEQTEMQAVLTRLQRRCLRTRAADPREMNVIGRKKESLAPWFMEQDGVLAGTAAIYREGGRWHMEPH